MSIKPSFRGCFDKQYGKRDQTRLKSASQHLYHIYWSLVTKLCSKKSLLLTCQILGMLLNTLATDEKYPVLNRENLTIPIQMELSEKKKNFFQFFAASLKSRLNFERFEKKEHPHSFGFPKTRAKKTWLDKCLKSPIKENPSTSNMANVSKHY